LPYCRKCGAEVTAESAFCISCGAAQTQRAVVTGTSKPQSKPTRAWYLPPQEIPHETASSTAVDVNAKEQQEEQQQEQTSRNVELLETGKPQFPVTPHEPFNLFADPKSRNFVLLEFIFLASLPAIGAFAVIPYVSLPLGFWFVFGGAAGLGVFIDARGRGEGHSYAFAWALGTFMLLIVVLPLYWYHRGHGSRPQAQVKATTTPLELPWWTKEPTVESPTVSAEEPKIEPSIPKPSTTQMFCTQCGAKVTRDSNFCTECGAKQSS
jgi:RNA polymerase subunit RPABC4/transcription elongation factor Spt4